jgi:essential nuclear protein 1
LVIVGIIFSARGKTPTLYVLRSVPKAIVQAERLFSRNTHPEIKMYYTTTVLLPRIRTDLKENKRLDPNLFNILVKSVAQTSTFCESLILPLCASNSNLRELSVLSSVISRASIPALHSATILLRLAELEQTTSLTYLIRAILLKNYSLPLHSIDAMVDYFVRSRSSMEVRSVS